MPTKSTANRRRSACGARRAGFTLVELLVVITILAILASLGVWAAFAALQSARKAAIAFEITQMSQAVETYAGDHSGNYPPDFSNDAAVAQHVRLFRRHGHALPQNLSVSPPQTYINAAQPSTHLDPSEALVYWLTRIRSNRVSPFPTGSLTPLVTPQNDLSGSPLIRFEFDKARLIDYDGDGWPSYYPDFGEQTPYVYIQSQTYASASFPRVGFVPAQLTGKGFATAYRSDLASEPYVDTGKFQIISAGLDGIYDSDNNPPIFNKSFPSGANYTRADEDNITSFTEGGSLADKRP